MSCFQYPFTLPIFPHILFSDKNKGEKVPRSGWHQPISVYFSNTEDVPFPPWTCCFTLLHSYFLGSKKGVRTHYLPGICTFSIHHSKFSTLHRWTKSSDQFTLASVIVQTKASVKLVSYAPSNASMKWSLLSGHNFPIFCFSHTVLCHPRLGILSLNSGDSRCMRHQGFLFPLLCRVTAEEDFED